LRAGVPYEVETVTLGRFAHNRTTSSKLAVKPHHPPGFNVKRRPAAMHER
jgi:hypothetical protein